MTRWKHFQISRNDRLQRCLSGRLRPAARRGAGFTLAEVAVALAIFVFGALAIVRIFPPALDVIRNSESRTAATMLAQGTIERQRRDTPPDAIFDEDFFSPTPPTLPTRSYAGAVTGSITRDGSLPRSVEASAFNASALNRFKRISGERHLVQQRTSPFIITQFPFDSATVFTEETLVGATIDEEGKLYYQDGGPVTEAATGVTYYVSYRWKDTTGQFAGGVVDEPLIIGGTQGQVLQGVLGNIIDTDTVLVRRRQELTPTPAASMEGYIPLNGVTPAVSEGSVVSVDYVVADWNWIVDDRVTSTPSFLLPIRYIEEAEPLHTMLLPPAAPPTFAPPASVDLKSARLTYGSITPSTRARTVYRTVDNWTHQLSVAARSYIPYVAGRAASSPRERWREYYHVGNTLYFHPNEAGKTILVTYLNTDGNVVENIVTIDQDIIARPTAIPFDFASSDKVSSIQPFVDVNGNTTGANAVLSIRGLGIQARTAWINGDRYSQSVVSDYRPVD